MGRGEGHGLAGQHGSDQTRGLSWEVAGGAGVPVSGGEARLLGHPHQPEPGTPEPWARGNTQGTQLTWPGQKAPGRCAAPPSPRPTPVPPGYCTSVAATDPVCPAAACTGEGPPSGRGVGLAAPPDRGVDGVRCGTGGWDVLELPPPPRTKGGLASMGTGPHPPARDQAHFSGALPAPTFRPVEPRAPLSLPPGGQSSWRGGILGSGSSGGRSLGLRPRFFPQATLFSSFLGARASWLLCLGGGSAEVRNQFWGEGGSHGSLGRDGARSVWALPGTPEATSRSSCQVFRGWPLAQTAPLPCPAPAPSGGQPAPPRAAHRPQPPTSACALRMWYLTPLSEPNSFGHSRQQYFPTRWSPCKTRAARAQVSDRTPTPGPRVRRPQCSCGQGAHCTAGRRSPHGQDLGLTDPWLGPGTAPHVPHVGVPGGLPAMAEVEGPGGSPCCSWPDGP